MTGQPAFQHRTAREVPNHLQYRRFMRDHAVDRSLDLDLMREWTGLGSRAGIHDSCDNFGACVEAPSSLQECKNTNQALREDVEDAVWPHL